MQFENTTHNHNRFTFNRLLTFHLGQIIYNIEIKLITMKLNYYDENNFY